MDGGARAHADDDGLRLVPIAMDLLPCRDELLKLRLGDLPRKERNIIAGKQLAIGTQHPRQPVGGELPGRRAAIGGLAIRCILWDVF